MPLQLHDRDHRRRRRRRRSGLSILHASLLAGYTMDVVPFERNVDTSATDASGRTIPASSALGGSKNRSLGIYPN